MKLPFNVSENSAPQGFYPGTPMPQTPIQQPMRPTPVQQQPAAPVQQPAPARDIIEDDYDDTPVFLRPRNRK